MEKKSTKPKISKPKAPREKKQEPVDFVKHYVKPHKKISRPVTKDDLTKVIEDAHILFNLCYSQHGMYPGGYAVAHSQINDTDPLRFFVTNQREIIINPVIVRHTAVKVDNEEGCLSFPDRTPIMVPRWNKCEVEFVTIDTTKDSGFSDLIKVQLSSKIARIFQHEVDHMDAIYIYDKID